MGRTVKLSISGRGGDTDAPTVEDALDQLRDYLDLLKGVEEAVAEGESNQIIWRIVNASRSSPLAIEIEAFPRQHALNIDRRVQTVVAETARGLASLQTHGERPRYFTNKVMNRAKKIFERMNENSIQSDADFGEDLPKVVVTLAQARTAARNVDIVLKPTDRAYKEVGSVEGHFQGVELDGFGRRIAFVKERITGESVKCLVANQALAEVGSHQISEVWHNRRVQASGKLHFRGQGKITQIEDARFRFFSLRADLPQVQDIIDPTFTSGLSSQDYLDRVRSGNLF